MRLSEAIEAGDLETVRALVADDPSLADSRAVILAKYRWEHEIAAELVAAGRPLDVFAASAVDRVDRARELLAADPGAATAVADDGFTPLHLAAYFGAVETARVLLAAGADPDAVAANPTRVRPLHSAAAGRHAEIVRMLLDAGADPAAEQEGGYTALTSAERNGDEDIAELVREATRRRSPG